MIWLIVLWCLTVAVCAMWCALKWRELDKADHAKCIAHVASVTSNRFLANAFRDAADRYDSIDGQAQLANLRNAVFIEGGSSIPALWLRANATAIDPDTPEWNYNEVAY